MASVDIWYLFDLSMDFKANINFVARFHADIQSLTIAIVFELIYYTNSHPRA